VGKDPTQPVQQKITNVLKNISPSHDVIQQLLQPHGLRMLRLHELQKYMAKSTPNIYSFIFLSFVGAAASSANSRNKRYTVDMQKPISSLRIQKKGNSNVQTINWLL
jgi:hypothetical protein